MKLLCVECGEVSEIDTDAVDILACPGCGAVVR